MVDQRRDSTWLPVSTELSSAPVWVFQVLMQRSAVPPPVASVLRSKGHHASAFTAAWCSVRVKRGAAVEKRPEPTEASQRQQVLSFDPEARVLPSGDQLRPQT